MDDFKIKALTFPFFEQAFHLQATALKDFYRLAESFSTSECRHLPPAPGIFDLRKNFFSTFFLAITANIAPGSPRLPLCAFVNQCMRAWVTACDNLLDSEYKEIFFFDIPKNTGIVKSVLTLMITDRILVSYINERYPKENLLGTVQYESLRALMTSAIQESEEEIRPATILPSCKILEDIHRRKTADLFGAPLALPAKMENIPPARLSSAHSAVENFGLACQILDDLADMPNDVRDGRHNYIVSLLVEKDGMERLTQLQAEPPGWCSWERFPELKSIADSQVRNFLNASFQAMKELGMGFSNEQQILTLAFLHQILGVPLNNVCCSMSGTAPKPAHFA